MFALPLVGWAMLSAAGYPIVFWGPTHLQPIAPVDPALYAALRQAHTVLALMLFLVVLTHVGAALFHAWVSPATRSSPAWLCGARAGTAGTARPIDRPEIRAGRSQVGKLALYIACAADRPLNETLPGATRRRAQVTVRIRRHLKDARDKHDHHQRTLEN